MTTTKTDYKRQERDRQRFLASELLSGLSDTHPYGQIYNVASEIDDECNRS